MSLWKPLLSQSHECISQSIKDIAEQLAPILSGAQDPTLAHGMAGAALFYSYLGHEMNSKEYLSVSDELVERIISRLNEAALIPSLYSGFSGVCWALENIQRLGAQVLRDDINDEIDGYIMEFLSHPVSRLNADLTDGLAGIGVYALGRTRRSRGRELFARVVRLLDEIGERPARGQVTWRSATDLINPEEVTPYPPAGHNLGLAHGVPGVIAVLAGGICADLSSHRCRKLLLPAVSWLLRQARHDDDSRSAFAYVSEEDRDARSAWCYGDPGVATALVSAAVAMRRPEWLHAGLDIACRPLRRPLAQSAVRDAGLCHGSSGLMHIYNVLHQRTGDPRFRRAAKGWAERTVRMRTMGRGIAGFAHFDPSTGGYVQRVGFLEGVSGIGLAMLATISTIPPRWDEVLVIAPRNHSRG